MKELVQSKKLLNKKSSQGLAFLVQGCRYVELQQSACESSAQITEHQTGEES